MPRAVTRTGIYLTSWNSYAIATRNGKTFFPFFVTMVTPAQSHVNSNHYKSSKRFEGRSVF